MDDASVREAFLIPIDRPWCDDIFPVTHSARGVIPINIGSHVTHVPQYFSARHQLLQLVQVACNWCIQLFICSDFSVRSFSKRKVARAAPRDQLKHLGSDIDNVRVQSYDNMLYFKGTTMISIKEETSSSVCATSQPGHNDFVLNSRNVKGNHVRKDIFMLRGGNHQRGTELASNDNPVVILDSQAQVNCTGDFSMLSSLHIPKENIVLIAANGEEMTTCFAGSVRCGRFELNDVHFSDKLGNRTIVSGSELDKLGYHYEFGGGKCIVRDHRTRRIVGKGHLVGGDYIMDYLKIPRERTPVPENSEGPSLVTSVWEAVCSFLRSFIGQTPQRRPM